MERKNFDVIYIFSVGTIAVFMLLFGFIIKLWPISDFGMHWEQVNSINGYIKGGGLFFIYYPFQKLNLPPSFSSTIVNVLSWLLLAYSIKPDDRKFRHKIMITTLLISFGIWWIPSANNVDVMQPHVALLAYSLTRLYSSNSKNESLALIIILALAISMRMQTVLFLLPIIFFYFIRIIIRYKNGKTFRTLKITFCTYILLSIFLGVGIELGLRLSSSSDQLIKGSQRTPLYAGILISNSKVGECGSWSLDASIFAKNELEMPLIDVFKRYLTKERLMLLPEIILCKYNRMIDFAPFSSYLTASHIDKSQYKIKAFIVSLAHLELSASRIIKLSFYVTFIYSFFRFCFEIINDKKVSDLNLFFIGSLLGILTVFAIFEFNSRYMYTVVCLNLVTYFLYTKQDVFVDRIKL